MIPTCQRSDIDLVRFGDVIEQEKDRLLERVHTHAMPPGSAVMLKMCTACRPTKAALLPCCALHPCCQSKADTYAMAVQFCEFAKAACDSLAADGYWADYIDPCSGLPVCTCIHM